MKILLVDASPTIRNVQKNVLRQLGHEEVIEAADGLEALIRLGESRPDLLLVDWNTPRMDGLTLVRKIREKDKALPIIMCSTRSDKARVVEAVRAGVNNYVIKPFSMELLREKIAQTMKQVAPTPAPTAPPGSA
jgi:two-component system chemotaxis response regulator CheY